MNTEKRQINGLQLAPIGFGGASLGNLYQAISEPDAREVVEAALSSGFSYLDTAPHYGQGLSERRLGDILRRYGRDEFTLSTKVGRLLVPDGRTDIHSIRPGDTAPARHGFVSPMPFNIHYDYSYDGVMRSYEASLQRLGLDKIDILYVHDIGTVTHGDENARHFQGLQNGGYRALEELRTSGDIKAIGLGVNEWQICEDAMEIGQWDVFLLAGRYSLLEQTALDSFFPKCEAHGSKVVLGGVYNSGILATGTRRGGQVFYNYEPAPKEIIQRVQAIEAVCELYDVALPAAALQFGMQHPLVASVIVGIGAPRRVAQTLALADAEIPSEFWSTLREQRLVDARAPLPGLINED